MSPWTGSVMTLVVLSCASESPHGFAASISFVSPHGGIASLDWEGSVSVVTLTSLVNGTGVRSGGFAHRLGEPFAGEHRGEHTTLQRGSGGTPDPRSHA